MRVLPLLPPLLAAPFCVSALAQVPCGHYRTPACPVQLQILRGVSGEQIFEIGNHAFHAHQMGAAIR